MNCCVCVLITTPARAGDTVTATLDVGEAKQMMQPRVSKMGLDLDKLRIPASPDGTQNRDFLCSGC